MTAAQKTTAAFWGFGFIAAVAWAGLGFSVYRGIEDWMRGETVGDADE